MIVKRTDKIAGVLTKMDYPAYAEIDDYEFEIWWEGPALIIVADMTTHKEYRILDLASTFAVVLAQIGGCYPIVDERPFELSPKP